MIKIIGLSRIHITLFDLEGKYGRIDGGVGVALKYPRIVIRTGDCFTPTVSLPFKVPQVCIEEDYEPHIGLGHTTQYLLAVAKLASEYNFKRLNSYELAKLVKRGGTSGIGVYAFEYGGFIVDGGHSTKIKKELLPSDFSSAPPPPLITRLNFPWYIYVNVPKNGKRIFGSDEINAFKEAKLEGLDTLARVVLMELIPSVAENDLEGALNAISLIQNLGFKKIEVSLQSDEVKAIMAKMNKLGFPAGLSSFGPTIYTFISSRKEGEELISRFGGFISEPNNEGAKVFWSTMNS
ncbi:beta-ribofuranosylaminobenzene 5'-phosphate synthase family protein [Sulfolobus tengchongensis]|uniref:Beta-ribofuranosylaminobenzene 5'-phosphate synthase n=1 Tax=Sulfolobus tengchongensis TaxID=207809 RepID=A0AAX4KZ84_9CREN